MMASAEPPSSFSVVSLLECLEDGAAGCPEQTDAYLTIANRLSGEEGRQFLPAVEKHFTRLGTAILAHISSPHAELSQAALQALGFCLYHSHVVSRVSETFAADILSALCSVASKSTEKNTCTRALWVISKQSFSADVVGKKVSSILGTLESIWSKDDVLSVVMEHEALNVIIKLLDQVPAQMSEDTVRWAKLIIPLVVHSASKVRLRAAAAMEMGLPLLLQKQTDVAAVIEPLMSTKLIPELQKLFMAKNETNVLKLWPLFVKLLGKMLHRGGPFINSLLHLEELGFRSSSPTVKKIAFIAWKSLIDNFALNPDILCSAKRMKLLMQPLMSINIRTEALMLTKVEVWWYLVVQLGPHLSPHFDQVSVPLLQCTFGSDSSSAQGTPARGAVQNGAAVAKAAGLPSFNSTAPTTRLSLNSSIQLPSTFPSIQQLGLEMLLHYFLGPEVVAAAAKSKLVLTLEPLRYPLLSATSSFGKHAAVLISSIKDGFSSAGKEAPGALLGLLWNHLVHFVSSTIESGSKKDRQGSEVLTLMLQALQSIIHSGALPADKVLVLFEGTVKGISPRVLGSASYQVGKMDVLNGTPALFLILLLLDSSRLATYIEDARFYQCLKTLVGCGLSGPTSPLAFGEAVLGAVSRGAASVPSKEHLLRMWSVMVGPLTDTITQSNEVNQGDALEHNFSAMHSALLFPVTHLLSGPPLQQAAHKSMLATWSKLYKVFARCSSLVVTAEENVCCEELCAKMAATVDREALTLPSTLMAVSCILQVMVECVDFSPYTPHFQQKLKSPHTPGNWTKKRSKALGNLSTFESLLVRCLDVYLAGEDELSSEGTCTGMALLSVLSALFTNLVLAHAVKEVLTSLIPPLAVLYQKPPKFTSQILAKMEKLVGEFLGCIQSRCTLAYDDDLLALLSPLLCVLFTHKNKQHRTAVAHFWNSTFANAVSLTYPENLRPVLNHVKQKTPIILPGFEAVCVPDELSGQYSSESSQLETKLSGVPVASAGKRDSQSGKTAEANDRSSARTTKPVSMKLDFGSPKVPRREVLEEEASVDFVFIPPETKERVLTEHQKEVKRTKRVDIPAMYNNLDASLDTTVFTQYTQSQEDSMGKPPTDQADAVAQDAPEMGTDSSEVADIQTEETQDVACPKALEKQAETEEPEMIPESSDVSMEEDAKSDARAEDGSAQPEKTTSPNTSVSGTPQKSSSGSRRQTFITLEKYAEGKPVGTASTVSTFIGPLVQTSSSQEPSKDSYTPSPEDSQKESPQNSESVCEETSACPVSHIQASPQRPKVDGERTVEPFRLIEGPTCDEPEDDVIPDTQTEDVGMENPAETFTSVDVTPSDPNTDSQVALGDLQSSEVLTSPGDPNMVSRESLSDSQSQSERTRAGRKRSKHLLPEDVLTQTLASSNRPNTRNRKASEEDTGRLRRRSLRESSESSQKNSQGRLHRKVKLYSNSGEFLTECENKRKSGRFRESSQTYCLSDSLSESSQSRRKRGWHRKSITEPKEEDGMKAESVKISSQTDFLSDTQSDSESQSQQRSRRYSKFLLGSNEAKPEEASSQSDLQSDSQSVSESQEERGPPAKDSLNRPETTSEKTSRETDLQSDTQSDSEILSQQRLDKASEILQQMEKGHSDTKSQSEDSQKDLKIGSLQTVGQTQKCDLVVQETNGERPSQIASSTSEFQDVASTTNGDSQVDEPEDVSQDYQQIVPASAETPPLKRRRRPSKASPEQGADQSEIRTFFRRVIIASSQENRPSEAWSEGRKRRSKSGCPCIPESSQSSDGAASTESPRGRGRYSRRRSANTESSESELSEARESPSSLKMSTKRRRKPRGISPSGRTGEPRTKMDAKDSATAETLETAKVEDGNLSKSQDSVVSQSLETLDNSKERRMDLAEALEPLVQQKAQPETAQNQSPLSVSPRKKRGRRRVSRTKPHPASLQEPQQLESSEMLVSEGIATEQSQEDLTCETSAADTSPEKLQEKIIAQVVESAKDSDSGHHGDAFVPVVEEPHSSTLVQDQECSNVVDYLSSAGELGASNVEEKSPKQVLEDRTEKDVPVHDGDKDGVMPLEETQTTGMDPDATPSHLSNSESTHRSVPHHSPAKLKDLEAALVQDMVQSPCSNMTRGTWSPSASPSSSILKKGQKRQLEEESPSPLVKQETADDIDRRSPAVRASSPRRSKVGNLPHPKFITTPTKGSLILSPRNLRSPSFKSSKKCLISEMSPVSKDCIYPALVGCSTPVEAVLPQISSSMWSRGFGQLVRARNIKTVGDLSALTPSEIKTLPIRSPKVSNVKKALKTYEEQRKGRGVDELKSFVEMEMMTSELEEARQTLNQDERSGALLATALLDQPGPPPTRLEEDPAHLQMTDPCEAVAPEALLGGPPGLLCQLDAVDGVLTRPLLKQCSPQQLLDMHQRLTGMTSRVVMEMSTRLSTAHQRP
ncbi:telomere-associated protein RIF1 isoform X2 [Dunckerocampus dactyliophorus]|uniref:telomere-associated protein RIF1 isoform X2 n=1 Tax=Dunckerocampus dactyliophorus TaxID=161453 RepID=UPI002405A058|nr:telomere-associated protein RIF1 isoform X2 [Dunckerocampus dactyliophorus]